MGDADITMQTSRRYDISILSLTDLTDNPDVVASRAD